MIRKLLYFCPACSSEDSLQLQDSVITCAICTSQFPFEKNKITYEGTQLSLSEFYALMRSRIPLKKNSGDEYLRISGRAVLRQGEKSFVFRGFRNSRSVIECPVVADHGHLIMFDDHCEFRGERKTWKFKADRFMAVTTNSKYFEFKIRNQPFYQIYFETESPLKYEDLFRKWISGCYSDRQIIEYQPSIRNTVPPLPKLLLRHNRIKNRKRERFGFLELLLYFVIGLPVWWFLKLNGGVEIINRHFIPGSGPFLLIGNHEGYLDPILLSVVLKRRIAFLTKSTAFCDPMLQPVFRAYRSIPNRRYYPDAQVIRHVLRFLSEGQPVGIFPEGERTWDGKRLPFKLNSVRLIGSVQVPLVFVRICGAYDVLPRWSKKVHRGKILIEVLPPVCLLDNFKSTSELKEYIESFFEDNHAI